MKAIKQNLVHEKLAVRIPTAIVLYLALFFGSAILSYFLLPEGLLRNKNPLQNWEVSNSLLVGALQIFSYNLLSVLVILCANLFANAGQQDGIYLPYGYIGLAVLYTLNGITLGTWSFSVEREWIPLADRLLQTFNLAQRAGLWEMLGQLLIACATAGIAIVKVNGKDVSSRKLREVRLSGIEKGALALGVCLMLAGALIESNAILQRL
jgi:hypothetical protein